MRQESKIKLIFQRRLIHYTAFSSLFIFNLILIFGFLFLTQYVNKLIPEYYVIVADIIRVIVVVYISFRLFRFMRRSTHGVVNVEIDEAEIRYSEAADYPKSFIKSRSFVIAWDKVKVWQITERYLSPFNIGINLNLDIKKIGRILIATDTFPCVESSEEYSGDIQSLLDRWLPAERNDPSAFNKANYSRLAIGYFFLTVTVVFPGLAIYAIVDDSRRLFDLEFLGLLLMFLLCCFLCWHLGRSFLKGAK